MTTSTIKSIATTSLAFVCCLAGLAGTKHAPLPEQIVEAKTAYIDNQSGIAGIADRAFDELSKWGRFKIVNSAKDADVVILFSAKQYVKGYHTTTTGTSQGTVDDSGDLRLNNDSTSQTTAQTGGITFMTVLDPKNGVSLWSDQKTWGNGAGLIGLAFARSATRSLVKELRKRVDEQEADSRVKPK